MSGIRALGDIRLRCWVDPETCCWHWRGAVSGTTPTMRLPALGRTISAGAAICWFRTGLLPAPGVVWHRTCRTVGCVAPHHRTPGTRASQMAFMRGKPIPLLQRARITAAKRSASGVSDAVVEAIRSSPLSCVELATLHGVSVSTASRYKRGTARRDLGAFAAWRVAA